MIEAIVKNTIEIRRVGEGVRKDGCLFFGKWFEPSALKRGPVVLVHDDYPNITEDQVLSFMEWSKERAEVVVSGTISPVHPYRLIKLDLDRHERYMVDVTQEIRGNRHFYPEVYCFCPALVYLPQNVSLKDTIQNIKSHGNLPELYHMDPSLLLDESLTLDGLLLRAYKHERE